MVLVHFSHNHNTDCKYLKFDELNNDYPIEHYHNYYEFTYVTNGSYIHQMNDKSFILNKDDSTFLMLKDHHSLLAKTPSISHTAIIIEKEYFERKCNEFSVSFLKLLKEYDLSKITLSPFETKRFSTYLNLLKSKTISEEKEEMITCLIVQNIIEVLYNYIQAADDNVFPEHFNRMLEALNKLENSSWRAKDLADFAGYTETHVNRLFQKYLGMSTNKYISKVKLANARYLLSFSDVSISEITAILGYISKSHFINTFKREYHITPYKYRLDSKYNKDPKKNKTMIDTSNM